MLPYPPPGEDHTPVILGEADDEALIWGVTLEILGLVFNPFRRTLEPMRMLLVWPQVHSAQGRESASETQKAGRHVHAQGR